VPLFQFLLADVAEIAEKEDFRVLKNNNLRVCMCTKHDLILKLKN
jgi:hypothetical protein